MASLLCVLCVKSLFLFQFAAAQPPMLPCPPMPPTPKPASDSLLTSRDNRWLKQFRIALRGGLQTDTGSVGVEGLRLVEEALESGCAIEAVLFSDSGERHPPSSGRSRSRPRHPPHPIQTQRHLHHRHLRPRKLFRRRLSLRSLGTRLVPTHRSPRRQRRRRPPRRNRPLRRRPHPNPHAASRRIPKRRRGRRRPLLRSLPPAPTQVIQM